MGLSAVILTTSGEVKAMILLGSALVVGSIAVEVFFHLRPKHTAEGTSDVEEVSAQFPPPPDLPAEAVPRGDEPAEEKNSAAK